jgi:hypothetical protein
VATQAETLHVLHECRGHQNKRHVMKVLKQHGITVEANKEFCDGCALEKAHWQRFGTQTSRPSIVEEQINICVWSNDRNISGWWLLLCLLQR